MSIEAGNKYVPEGNDVFAAFSVVNQWHFTIGKTREEIFGKPIEKIAKAASDYLTAGVAFLANRSKDKYFEDIGTTTWHAINQKRVLSMLTDNMFGAAIQLGVPFEIAINQFGGNDKAYVLFTTSKSGKISRENAVVLLPPEFVVDAQIKPINALSALAWISSQVCDLVHERFYMDKQNMNPRADATEAHFLLEVLKRYPDTELSSNKKKLVEVYPKGIMSLPEGMRYKIRPRPVNLN